jgi:hypothetical protein
MTYTARKYLAQENLLHGLQTAFCDSDLSEETRKEMDKQMRRVEKLFGYTQGSWARGA